MSLALANGLGERLRSLWLKDLGPPFLDAPVEFGRDFFRLPAEAFRF